MRGGSADEAAAKDASLPLLLLLPFLQLLLLPLFYRALEAPFNKLRNLQRIFAVCFWKIKKISLCLALLKN